MDRRRTGFLLMGMGAVIALLVGLVVALQLKGVEELKSQKPTRWAVVAASDIEPRSVIQPNQVELTLVPATAYPIGTESSFEPSDSMPPAEVETQKNRI